ncbi:hypothetical protein AB3S75_026948 [Citrus x aurantiifolia]
MNLEKQTIDSETHDVSSSQEKLETRLLIFVLYSSFAIALLILFLPHQNVNGSPVPTFLFAAHPSLFHALVLAVMLSFAAASSGFFYWNQFPAAVCNSSEMLPPNFGGFPGIGFINPGLCLVS